MIGILKGEAGLHPAHVAQVVDIDRATSLFLRCWQLNRGNTLPTEASAEDLRAMRQVPYHRCVCCTSLLWAGFVICSWCNCRIAYSQFPPPEAIPELKNLWAQPLDKQVSDRYASALSMSAKALALRTYAKFGLREPLGNTQRNRSRATNRNLSQAAKRFEAQLEKAVLSLTKRKDCAFSTVWERIEKEDSFRKRLAGYILNNASYYQGPMYQLSSYCAYAVRVSKLRGDNLHLAL